MPKTRKQRILIVDDDENMLEVISTGLQDAGYLVDTARNAADALEKSGTNPYNLALLENRLPDMEGTKLLARIKDARPGIITAILTGCPTLQNTIEAVNNGVDAYLVKPVRMNDLLEFVRGKLKNQLPILSKLVPGGFGYGINLLVEFDPKSIWYEISLTIAAHALRYGIRTDYHTFQHNPTEVLEYLAKLGLNVESLQEDDSFSIIDSYTTQMGLGKPKIPTSRVHYQTQSVRLSDWSIAMSQEMKTGHSESEKGRLHIDDNTSVLLQYNEEKLFTDFWRTHAVPVARGRQLAFLHSLATGVYSDALYRQFERIVTVS